MTRYFYGAVSLILVAAAFIAANSVPVEAKMNPLTFAGLIILTVFLLAAFIFYPEPISTDSVRTRNKRIFLSAVALISGGAAFAVPMFIAIDTNLWLAIQTVALLTLLAIVVLAVVFHSRPKKI
jgi:hypothetical protein